MRFAIIVSPQRLATGVVIAFRQAGTKAEQRTDADANNVQLHL